MIYSKSQFNHRPTMAAFVVEFYGGQVLQLTEDLIEFRCSSLFQAKQILYGLRKE